MGWQAPLAMATPPDISPVWCFTPDYVILRAVPNKALGALLPRMARVSLALLPWLDRPPVKSIGDKGWISRLALAVFVVFCIDSATSACSRWSRCT